MNPTMELEKELAAKEAVKHIRDGQIVGLGTGSTALYAIREIALLVQQGLKIHGIPTSNKTKELALSLHIPLIDINAVDAIDVTIDGADEFTEGLELIKGGGGALVREKIVAGITKKEIIITDASKKVELLGKFKVPVAVVPFAYYHVINEIKKKGGNGSVRRHEDVFAGNTGRRENITDPFLTDDGNYVLDMDFGLIEDPEKVADELQKIEGIVAHGLFLKLTRMIIMGRINETIRFGNFD